MSRRNFGQPIGPEKVAYGSSHARNYALLGAVGGRVSRRTIFRALQPVWQRKWLSIQRIPISEEIAASRLQFSRDWEGREDELVETIFSDESTVQNRGNNNRGWVFRKPHERFQRAVVNVTYHGKPEISLMVWAGIWRGGRTPLVIMRRDPQAPRRGYTARSYRDALRDGLLPSYDGTRRFQQDNAKIHLARDTVQWLQVQAIEYIDWPSHSPDLKPIEHAWRALKQELITQCPHLQDLKANAASIAELEEKLKLAWDALPQDLFDRLIESMPRRLAAVRRARGYYTKY
ncbi:hypothetical protein HIM_12591 [Hirsutella minnesotensis 3608]|uniref:Tc1-like transposase DDE domain-containing protein n=1 Tax=Hirsutella minnesotensis 3608 TaxID=1043627 RepID=A0A0F7ZZX3_9HYPO|nr:hypothetical protein HIM_12591 [Hirsutella minnesotensis 3608]